MSYVLISEPSSMRHWTPRPLSYCADLAGAAPAVRAVADIPRRDRIHHAYNPQQDATVDDYINHYARYYDWAVERDIDPNRPRADDVAAFAFWAVGEGVSKAYVEHMLTAIHVFNYSNDNPKMDSRMLREAYRFLHKRPDPDVPVATFEEVMLMLEAAGFFPAARRVRDRAILSLLWTLWLRESEMAELAVEWCHFLPDGLIVRIPESKTDKKGNGQPVTAACNHAGVCPVCSLREWLSRARIISGPVWRKIDRWGTITGGRVGHNMVSELTREYGRHIGLKEPYGAHAFRRGGASYAFSIGVPMAKIKQQLRHRSWRSTQIYIKNLPIQPRDCISRFMWG